MPTHFLNLRALGLGADREHVLTNVYCGYHRRGLSYI